MVGRLSSYIHKDTNLFKHPQSGYNNYNIYITIFITLFLKTYLYILYIYQSIVEFVKLLKS